MKRAFLNTAAVAALAATTAAAQVPAEPPVPVKVDFLPYHVRERVRQKAGQGITALARYLERTRTVYQLRLMDVVAGYDRPIPAMGDADAIDRELERSLRAGRGRPVR